MTAKDITDSEKLRLIQEILAEAKTVRELSGHDTAFFARRCNGIKIGGNKK